MILTKHKIIIGDARNMKEITDESVHLVVTSPPYWQLKDYGNKRQIGFNDTYEEYINNLNLVWQECFRVLHAGTRMCINIGDQFARAVYYGRYKVIPIRTEIIKFAEAAGFDYLGSIIWQKKTTKNTTGGASIMGSYPYPRNGIVEIDYEFILIFKKPGDPPSVGHALKEQAKLSKEEWKEYFSGHWYFNGVRQLEHTAMFPEELPKRLIKMFTFPGEIVLDPFLGSGTTTVAAIKLGRNSIGYEINSEFLPLIKQKIKTEGRRLEAEVRISKQEDMSIDFQERVKKLPYVFKDRVKFNKRIDPKKLNFGSKITMKDAGKREDYLRIKKVISPEKVLLSNDLEIRLIGVSEIPDKRNEAMEFLQMKTSNTQIFLRFDNEKYDKQGILKAYIYLKNKTFLNAHLIKRGLAQPSFNDNFKYREKFLSLV